MNLSSTWNDPLYRQTVLIVLSIIFASGIIVFFLRKQNYYFVSAWASIKSWLVAAPLLFIVFGLPAPWPLIVLTWLAIMGAKVFFQIMGMFHRTSFVLICYAGIIGLGLAAHFNRLDIYNSMPMIVLGAACLVPLFLNAYNRMIQYISLTLLAFIFLGWSFMHLGLLMTQPNGVYQLLYLIVLTEFCDNTNLAIGYLFKGPRLFANINPKRSLYGTVISVVITLALAAAMKQLLSDTSDKYWLAAGIVASLGGMIGDLIMGVVRRDAGVRLLGPFIIGRGDYLQRMDRLIFVAPIYYYVLILISNW